MARVRYMKKLIRIEFNKTLNNKCPQNLCTKWKKTIKNDLKMIYECSKSFSKKFCKSTFNHAVWAKYLIFLFFSDPNVDHILTCLWSTKRYKTKFWCIWTSDINLLTNTYMDFKFKFRKTISSAKVNLWHSFPIGL